MDLNIFNQPDPSGKMTKESYLFKNHKKEYDYIVNYCENNNIFDIPFKEKVYMCLKGIDKHPTCRNPNCHKKVSFINSTLGYREYCSNKCISSDPNIKELKKSKSLEKFGTNTPAQSDLIKQKIIKTNKERYGGNSPMSSEITQEKSKKTLKTNYGVDNPAKSKDILEKRVISFKSNIEQYKESYKKTSLERYGVIHPWCNKDIHGLSILNSIESKNNTIKKRIENRLIGYKQYSLLNIEFNAFKRNIIIFCSNCGKDFNINREDFYIRYREKTTICTNCNPINSNISGQQEELLRFIKNYYDGEISVNKKIIYPQEIDIYLPDIKLGIEFNGLYWHSESQKGKYYHKNKSQKCLENGISLIHIWEDDWVYKNEIVKSIILNRIGKNKRLIYSRKCIISLVSLTESEKFLEENHILGNCKSNIKIGLYHGNELVSFICFTKRGKDYELSRFCNKINTTVIGSLSKMLNYFKNNYDFISIISYSDNSMFDGKTYQKVGFEFVDQTPINYKWVISKKRLHKSNFRKSRLVKSGHDINKSESDIMIEDVGAFKVWDCGLKKWILKNNI